ncbi:MAG: hypothetical protein QOJ13_2811 [Gaiellales bacterium]|jgi:hypothetical protein|nr:hypothetical protein [Gaiellales bacterium]
MYLLDANVFIEAKQRYYSFEVVPAFWDWLDQAYDDGRVASVRKVLEELEAGADELAQWAVQRPDFFLDVDDAALGSLRRASTWATTNGYETSAVNEFLESGDYYLVGQAHAHGHTVVTHETASTGVKRIKIPNACGGLSVPHMNAHAMLRAEGARFVLG